MNRYHQNDKVDVAMIALADALSEHERETDQKSVLLLLPTGQSPVTLLLSGIPANDSDSPDVLLAIALGYAQRGESDKVIDRIRSVAISDD